MIKAAGTAGKKCLWGPGPHGRKVRWCLVDMLLSVPLSPFWALHPLQHHTGHLQNSTYGQHGPVFPQSPLENRTQNLTQAEPVRVLSLDFRSCRGKARQRLFHWLRLNGIMLRRMGHDFGQKETPSLRNNENEVDSLKAETRHGGLLIFWSVLLKYSSYLCHSNGLVIATLTWIPQTHFLTC